MLRVELSLHGIQNNAAVQLRIVQPEHGGGYCNCWTVQNVMLESTNNNNIDLMSVVATP